MNDLHQFYSKLKEAAGTGGDHIRTVRDLTLIDLAADIHLVIACDSDGGIGPKERDLVNVPGEVLGRFATRVPLMEILASGARPMVVVNTLAVEMDPTGLAIIEGVRKEAALAGLTDPGSITGSTEDNVPTVATGMGVVIVGLVDQRDFRPGGSQPDDRVVCVGLPKSAPDDEVSLDDPEIADTATTLALAGLDYIHDLLPVGSKGIIHEQDALAGSAGLILEGEAETGVDIHKSAGPSTCLLASIPPSRLDELRSAIKQPISVIGTLVEG